MEMLTSDKHTLIKLLFIHTPVPSLISFFLVVVVASFFVCCILNYGNILPVNMNTLLIYYKYKCLVLMIY